jgi:histone H1/5
MVKEAIINLKERNGSSRQAIKKYIQANNNLGATTDAMFSSHLSRAIAAGEKSGDFSRPKGPSGPVKLAKKEAKPAAPAKKTAAPKKTTKAAAPKKAATKPKANAGRPRKTVSSAPAVTDEPARILGKTKSGRVTKTKAPAFKPAKKAAATKKTPTKKATPKKATPKKAEA